MTFLGMPGSGNLRGDEPFPTAARRALRDTQMRRNVGHATHTIRTKRLGAVSECVDWEELREAGSEIKDDVLARLPELLEELEANVTAGGGVVHWARDAHEANAIVTSLVRATGADEVVFGGATFDPQARTRSLALAMEALTARSTPDTLAAHA